jgi:hypothetical protein
VRSQEQKQAEETKTKKPLLLVLGLLVVMLGALSSFGGAASKATKSAPDSRATTWVQEVLDSASARACEEAVPRMMHGRKEEVEEQISVWEEEARVDPAEYLALLQSVEATFCPGQESQARNGEGRRELAATRARLREHLERVLRAHQARLRRAERAKDKEAQLVELRALRMLLSFHKGGLSGELDRRISQLAPEGGFSLSF